MTTTTTTNITRCRVWALRIFLFVTIALIGPDPAQAAAVLIWRFSEAAGTSASDSSGNAHHGALNGGVSWGTGISGGGLSFNGSSGYVQVNDSASLDLTNAFTLAASINPGASQHDMGVISKVGASLNGYQMALQPLSATEYRLLCLFNETNGVWPQFQVSMQPIPVGVWSHVACKYDGNNLSIYLNGEPANSVAIGAHSVIDSSASFRIGVDDNNAVWYFGLLDEVRVYNHALSDGEIQVLARGGLALWHGDSTANDAIGVNHGSLQNGTGFANGRVGQAFNLDGIDDFVQVAAPQGLPSGNAPRSMAIWFRTPRDLSSSTESALIQCGSANAGEMFGLITSANAPGKLYFYGHGADQAGTTTILPNTWYHGAVTYDGTTMRLYVNGLEEAAAPIGLNTVPDANGLTIGQRHAGTIWQGELDEAVIFDRALSANEVRTVYWAGRGSTVVDVCPGCANTTIQSAVGAIPDGRSGTVRVAQGSYAERIVVDTPKTVRVEGGWSSDFASRSTDPSLTTVTSGTYGIFTARAGTAETISLALDGLRITGAGDSNYAVGGAVAGEAMAGGHVVLGVDNCLLTGNGGSNAHGAGVGLVSSGSGSIVDFTMNRTRVIGNAVTFYFGAGMYLNATNQGTINAALTNNLIANNSAMYGGGITMEAEPSGHIQFSSKNDTITNNLAWQYSYYGGGLGGGLLVNGLSGTVLLSFTNSIVWDNNATNTATKDIYLQRHAAGSLTLNATYSDIGVLYDEPVSPSAINLGAGMQNVPPLFVSPTTGNYRLLGGSLLVDAGTAVNAPTIDLNGRARPVGAGIDIGAFEGPPPGLSLPAALKVSEGAASARLTVSRSGDSNGAVSVDYATADGSALATSDYTASAGTLSWADGETTAKTISVPIVHDSINEASETFTVTLSNPTGGAILGNAAAAVTITDDDPNTPFADTAGNWALGYINAIYGAGITTGCGSGNYCPANDVTREQMAAFLIRAREGEPPTGYCGTTNPFADVPYGSPMCRYIKRLFELGITTGCGSGNYCPTQNVTREQMAAFIVRALEGNPATNYCGTTNPFADVPYGSPMCRYIKRLAELNVTTGCGSGHYCPTAVVTRDQMAAFLARAFLGM